MDPPGERPGYSQWTLCGTNREPGYRIPNGVFVRSSCAAASQSSRRASPSARWRSRRRRTRLPAPELAAGIASRARSRFGARSHLPAGPALLNAAGHQERQGVRDRAIVAVLLGCGLRPPEVAARTDGRCSGIHAGGDGRRTAREYADAARIPSVRRRSRRRTTRCWRRNWPPASPASRARSIGVRAANGSPSGLHRHSPERPGHHDGRAARPRHHRRVARLRPAPVHSGGAHRWALFGRHSRWRRRSPHGTRMRRGCRCGTGRLPPAISDCASSPLLAAHPFT